MTSQSGVCNFYHRSGSCASVLAVFWPGFFKLAILLFTKSSPQLWNSFSAANVAPNVPKYPLKPVHAEIVCARRHQNIQTTVKLADRLHVRTHKFIDRLTLPLASMVSPALRLNGFTKVRTNAPITHHNARNIERTVFTKPLCCFIDATFTNTRIKMHAMRDSTATDIEYPTRPSVAPLALNDPAIITTTEPNPQNIVHFPVSDCV